MIKKNTKNSILCKNAVLILKSFTPNQLQRFEAFIYTDFFRITKNVKVLFEIIISKIEHTAFVGFSKKELEKLFKPTKFDSKIPMNLNKTIEKFYIQEELSQEKFTQQHLLMKFYLRNGKSNSFEKTSKSAINQQNKNQQKGQYHQLNNFLLHESIYLHPSTEKHQYEVLSQKEMLTSLDTFFCISKLKLAMELLLRKNFVKQDSNIFGLNEVLKYAKSSSSPCLQFYTKLFLEIKKKKFSKSSFLAVQKEFEKEINIWNHEEQRVIIQFLINYITSFINKSNHNLFYIQLQLFEFGLKNDMLLDHKKIMTYTTFSNILTTFLQCEEYEKASEFIIDSSKRLDSSIQKNAILFATGYIAMAKKDFRTAIKKLSEVDKKSEVSKLQVNCFLLKCSFEQYLIHSSFKTLLTSNIKRFQYYFRKNSLHAIDRNMGFLELSRTLRKFYTILEKNKNPKDCILKLSHFNDSIINTEPIMMKVWVINKVHQEIKRRKLN